MSGVGRCVFCSQPRTVDHPSHRLTEIWPDWQRQALCADEDFRFVDFFPENGMSDRPAKRVCFACPVRKECLALALRRPERLGIWGASTAEQRKEVRALKLGPLETFEMALTITETSGRKLKLYQEEVA